MKRSLYVCLIMLTVFGVALSACGTNNRVSITTATESSSSTSTPGPTNSILSSITVAPISPSSDPTLAYEPPPLTSSPQFVIIKAGLVFGDDQPETHIPLGSTIYHWKNKITEVIGPDNSLIFVCKDTEATQIPTPGGGPQPATRVYQVPNGAIINADKNNKSITRIYSGNDVIGTIVDKPEDFPYTPTQIRNVKQPYIALGTYADGTTSDITSKVTWSSSDPAIATISSTGLVTALANGTTNITASLSGITSLAVDLTVHTLSSISIATWNGVGAPRTLTSLAVSSNWRLYASGNYSDGSFGDISSEITWISSNPSVATIDSTGLITAVSDGTDEIMASLYGITSPTLDFPVVSLSSINVAAPTRLTVGSKTWVSALGIYRDGSTDIIHYQVIWNSSDTAVAAISTDGLVTAIAEGTTNITASANGIVSKPILLMVAATSSTSTNVP